MLSLIVAYDKNKNIGKNNTIPWRLKADMLRVKSLTTSQTIVMGRKTFESIGRALPNRINRVLTRNKQLLKDYSGIEIFTDENEILENIVTDKCFIFGGEIVYKKFLARCNEMFITEIDADIEGDTKFPDFNIDDWQLISEEKFSKDEFNEFDYRFLHYKRKEV